MGCRLPAISVASGDLRDLGEALRVDQAAFDSFWRFDRTALLEAVQATGHRAIHLVRRPGGGLAGYAITGRGGPLAYLQRVAVDPAWQGRGLGRSLVRSSAAWAEAEGVLGAAPQHPRGQRPRRRPLRLGGIPHGHPRPGGAVPHRVILPRGSGEMPAGQRGEPNNPGPTASGEMPAGQRTAPDDRGASGPCERPCRGPSSPRNSSRRGMVWPTRTRTEK